MKERGWGGQAGGETFQSSRRPANAGHERSELVFDSSSTTALHCLCNQIFIQYYFKNLSYLFVPCQRWRKSSPRRSSMLRATFSWYFCYVPQVLHGTDNALRINPSFDFPTKSLAKTSRLSKSTLNAKTKIFSPHSNPPPTLPSPAKTRLPPFRASIT